MVTNIVLLRLALTVVFLALQALAPLRAQCVGENLLATLPAEERARLEAMVDQVPFPRGNFWRATRGGQVVHLMGTYHFDDPRHAATLTTLSPFIAQAGTVLVEAGPDEERALQSHLAKDPSLMMITEGPTLLEQMDPGEWEALKQARAERGIPGFIAAKMQPWYANLMLAIPTCAVPQAQDMRGLDGMIIKAATDAGIPVQALEPYDTLFSLFDQMQQGDQIAMMKTTLALDPIADDMAATLTEAYFAEDSRLIWDFMRERSYTLPGMTRAKVDDEFAKMEAILMVARNRAWIPVIEDAAAKGPVFAAFGALHLSGEDGVLNLLQSQGFTLERLPL